MKLLLKISALLFTLLAATIIVIVTLVDPNDYKQQIQEQVYENSNRELNIVGDISWGIYPLLGFKIGETTLANPTQFSEKNLLSVKESALSLNFLPLLQGKIEVNEIILDGVYLNLITNSDGVTNLDDLLAAQTTQPQKTQQDSPSQPAAEPLDLSSFKLSGIRITDTHLQVIDHLNKEQQKLTIESMTLGELSLGQRTPLTITSKFKNNQLDTKLQLSAELFIDKAFSQLSLYALNIHTQVTSQALLGTTIDSKFSSEISYQVEKQNLVVNNLQLHSILSGTLLNGDISLDSKLLTVQDNNKLSINQLSVISNLTGTLLQNSRIKTIFETQLNADITEQSASIGSFKWNNVITGDTVNGDLNLSFEQLKVTDFKRVLIEKLALFSELDGNMLNNKKHNAKLETDLSYDLEQQKLTLSSFQTQFDKLKLGGELSFINQVIPIIRYQLKGNVWNLNPYLASESTDNTPSSAPQTESEQVEPDLSILNKLDIEGDLTLDGLLYQDITINKITQHLVVKDGKAKLAPLTAQLYDGSLYVNALLNEANGQNQYKATTKIKNVTLFPLLKDAAQMDMLSGTASLNLMAQGQGLNPDKIQKQIDAKGDFTVTDGELFGVNIPKEIRLLKAKIKGETLPEEKQIKKTDFASLTGNFTVQEGIAENQKLLMLSPVMRLDGTGSADTIKQTIDYKLGITPLSKSDEKTDYLDLSGVTIPLLVSGTFTEPSFSLDTDGALKEQIKAQKKALQEKAKQALENTLEGKSNDDLKQEAKDLKNQLKSLF